jgi:transposase, IS5 family
MQEKLCACLSQRRGARNPPLSDGQERRNRRIAKTRARVEYVFGAFAPMGGKLIRTIGQEQANFVMTLILMPLATT